MKYFIIITSLLLNFIVLTPMILFRDILDSAFGEGLYVFLLLLNVVTVVYGFHGFKWNSLTANSELPPYFMPLLLMMIMMVFPITHFIQMFFRNLQ